MVLLLKFRDTHLRCQKTSFCVGGKFFGNLTLALLSSRAFRGWVFDNNWSKNSDVTEIYSTPAFFRKLLWLEALRTLRITVIVSKPGFRSQWTHLEQKETCGLMLKPRLTVLFQLLILKVTVEFTFVIEIFFRKSSNPPITKFSSNKCQKMVNPSLQFMFLM